MSEDVMEYTNIQNFDIDEIKTIFREKRAFECVFPFINRDTEIFLSHVLSSILEEVNQDNLYSHLEYALNELSMNASKANSKRLYFKSKSLDINNASHYMKGMASFKKDVLENFSIHEESHIEKECFVKIELFQEENILNIRITNGNPLVLQEKERIQERLKTAHKFENLTDVLQHGFDTIEGGGLGLIIMVLMLRKINLDEKSLSYSDTGNQSNSTLKIPLNLLSKEQAILVAEEITREINLMPQFPESIVALQRELSNPNCSFQSVADTINSDISLTAEILRIANSPVYIIKNQITDVNNAVRLIGMLGVKSVLYNYGANKVLSLKYNKKAVKEINEHSFNVALIASYLAQYKNLGRLSEEIYVAALLHDMGKIILQSLHKDLENKITDLCREKHIPVSILDDLTDGYNHSLIGSKIAEKWNFPEKYINVIAFHHLPVEVEEQYKLLTYSVYLSNEIYYLNKGERNFNDLNQLVLRYFGLNQKENFTNFINTLSVEGFGI